MMHFQGERSFPTDPAETFARLADAAFIVHNLPNVTTIIEATPDRAVWKLKPGLSFVQGTLEATLTVVERSGDSVIRTEMQTKGIGAVAGVASRLEGMPRDGGGSTVRWSSEITKLEGLLKMVPKPLIIASANKVIEDSWTAIEKRMGE